MRNYEEKFSSIGIKSRHLEEWLNLMCNTEKRYDDFINNFMDEKDLFHSACKYQRYLRESEGRGNEIDIKLIENMIRDGELEKVHVILEDIFMEPIDIGGVESLIDLVGNKNASIKELFDLYCQDSDMGYSLLIKKLQRSYG